MQKIYHTASSSSSVVYGNITELVKQFIKSNFPQKFFNYETVTTELGYRNLRRQLMKNKKSEEMVKRKKPYLIIRPQVQVPNDGYLYDAPIMKSYSQLENIMDFNALDSIYYDTQNNYGLKYRLNRDRVDFDITITVSQLLQQIDTYKNMINHFSFNTPFVYGKAIEGLLPKSIVRMIGVLSGVTDVPNIKSENLPVLLNYLNQVSPLPITYKIQNSTKVNEFFVYYPTQVLFTLSDLSISDGNKKGAMDDSFDITFRVSTEFTYPSNYYVYTKDAIKSLQVNLIPGDDCLVSDFIPIVTLNSFQPSYRLEDSGFILYRNTVVAMDATEDTEDVYFKDLLDLGIQEFLSKSIFYNNPLYECIDFIIYRGSELLILGNDYEIDSNKLRIIIKNPTNEINYRILIYINNLKINQENLEEILEFSNDKPHL